MIHVHFITKQTQKKERRVIVEIIPCLGQNALTWDRGFNAVVKTRSRTLTKYTINESHVNVGHMLQVSGLIREDIQSMWIVGEDASQKVDAQQTRRWFNLSKKKNLQKQTGGAGVQVFQRCGRFQ